MEIIPGLDVWCTAEVQIVRHPFGIDHDEIEIGGHIQMCELPEQTSKKDALPAARGSPDEQVWQSVQSHPERLKRDLCTEGRRW
jgi:hypothetical protein